MKSPEDFKRHAKNVGDLLKDVMPANMSAADRANAAESWGNRTRALKIDATHRDMAPGAYAATRNERPESSGHVWPTPQIDGSQAKYWDKLVSDAVALDRKEGL